MGIEPTTSAWKAEVLPLNYTRIFVFTGREDRIRTCDPMVPNHVLYQAELLPGSNGAPERSRTPNLLIRSQTLYPIELRALFCDKIYNNTSEISLQDVFLNLFGAVERI